MRVVITGAGGFIGKNLLLGLSGDHQLLALARGGKVPDFIARHSLESVTVREGDLNDERFLEELSALAPYGEGNPMPVFLFTNNAAGGQIVGNNHLRLTLSHQRGRMDAIGYGLGDRLTQLNLNHLQIAASPTINFYRDRRSVQLRIVDIRSEESKPATAVKDRKNSPSTSQLDRNRLGTIFRLIRSSARNDTLSRAFLYEKSAEAGISKEEAYLALIIFAELDFLHTRGDRIDLVQTPEKRDLSQSPTFRRLTESR